MRAFAIVWVHILFTLLIVGCERQPLPTVASTTVPATTQSVSEASLEPATMTIDGHVYDFPPVKISIEMKEDHFSALLLTDDPPNSTSEEYRGNSLYLPMSMEVPTGNSLAGIEWTFKTADVQRADEIDGIYMQGHRKFLQPLDVRVRIESDTPPLKVSVDGQFILFDDEDETKPPRKVNVSGELSVRVELKGAR